MSILKPQTEHVAFNRPVGNREVVFITRMFCKFPDHNLAFINKLIFAVLAVCCD